MLNDPTRPEAVARASTADASVDPGSIPARPVLIGQQDDVAILCGPRGPSRILEQHQRQQAERLRVGQQIDHEPAKADRLIGQVLADDGCSGGGRVSLGEHEIDDAQHCVQSGRQLLGRRHLVSQLLRPDARLGAHDPLGNRGTRRQGRRARSPRSSDRRPRAGPSPPARPGGAPGGSR